MIEINEPLPGLDRMATSRIIAFFSDITCGENCWNAKEEICRCECGGKNHGINRRGGNAVRTCRIDGYRYEVLAVGKAPELTRQVEELCRERNIAKGTMRLIDGKLQAKGYTGNWFTTSYIHPSEYNRGGCEYVLKLATLSQCIKWKELEYLQVADDRDRYHIRPAILWQRKDIES